MLITGSSSVTTQHHTQRLYNYLCFQHVKAEEPTSPLPSMWMSYIHKLLRVPVMPFFQNQSISTAKCLSRFEASRPSYSVYHLRYVMQKDYKCISSRPTRIITDGSARAKLSHYKMIRRLIDPPPVIQRHIYKYIYKRNIYPVIYPLCFRPSQYLASVDVRCVRASVRTALLLGSYYRSLPQRKCRLIFTVEFFVKIIRRQRGKLYGLAKLAVTLGQEAASSSFHTTFRAHQLNLVSFILCATCDIEEERFSVRQNAILVLFEKPDFKLLNYLDVTNAYIQYNNSAIKLKSYIDYVKFLNSRNSRGTVLRSLF